MKLLLILLVLGTAFATQEYIDGEYLIVLKEHADEEALVTKLKTDYSVDVKKAYRFTAITIMLIKGDDADVERAAKLSEVKSIDRNMIYYTNQCSDGSAAGCWGLDRTDQREALTNTDPANPEATYNWGEDIGSGVYAYIVDSGIDITHSEFGGRAIWGHSAGTLPEEDDNAHGTHCAGTVGSDSYGLAKNVTLVAVKVLNRAGSGSTGDIVEGLNWVTTDHNDRGTDSRSVINMSLGGTGSNAAMEAALLACINAGVIGVVAAGNSGADACNYTPAQLPEAITVGALDVTDRTASFTNWGSCVDIFAPGVDILSTVPDEGTDIYDGTSMACPHVVGAVARFIGSPATRPTPTEVVEFLTTNANADMITFRAGHAEGSPDLLLHAPCTLATPK